MCSCVRIPTCVALGSRSRQQNHFLCWKGILISSLLKLNYKEGNSSHIHTYNIYFKYFQNLCAWMFCLNVYLFTNLSLVLTDSRRRCQICWNWSYKPHHVCAWNQICALKSCPLNHWTIAPGLCIYIKNLWLGMVYYPFWNTPKIVNFLSKVRVWCLVL